MSLDDIKKVLEIITTGLTGLAIIVGGVWAYFRFVRERQNASLIDFSVAINFIFKKDDWWIVEIIAYVENKGKVQHRIKEFTFEMSSIAQENIIEVTERFNNQVLFPNTVAAGSFLLPSECKYFFIEPGLKNKYSYITRVHTNSLSLMLHSNFKYVDNKRFHTAEITVSVPAGN